MNLFPQGEQQLYHSVALYLLRSIRFFLFVTDMEMQSNYHKVNYTSSEVKTER